MPEDLTREQAINIFIKRPYLFGHLLGFEKLTELHNKWIVEMITNKEDKTLQAHRGSYKTTCVSIAISIMIVLYPNKKIMFLRKTDNDIKEIMLQVQKILQSPQMLVFVNAIYGKDKNDNVKLFFRTANNNELTTNLSKDYRGTAQLYATGINGSLTGKHFDYIFTDDIVNVQDRISKAEREHTKIIYQELRNIINRGGRIFNTGTPWHNDDCFSIMPAAVKYDCYSTGLIPNEELNKIKEAMTASLFAANYELRHIAAEDVIFINPNLNAPAELVEQGIAHIDAAYGGEDYTAFTICKKSNDKYYIYGRLWKKHIDDCLDDIQRIIKVFKAGKIYCEDNGDKGYLAKELKSRGERAVTYHEDMNKFLKITSYLKSEWNNVYFVNGTDKEYINQICDYNENAEHDDAPDGLASVVRMFWKKKKNEYKPFIYI